MGRSVLVTLLALVACNDAAPGGSDDPTATYSVVLTDAGEQKIAVIKVIREATGLGLRDAKAIADSAPSVVRSGLVHGDAATIAEQLASVGAKVELKSQR